MTSTTFESKPLPSLWRQVFGIIDQPKTTFALVTARPGWARWAVPLFIWLLAFTIFIVVQAPYTLAFTRETMEGQLATMPPEQAEAVRSASQFTMTLPFILAAGLVSGILLLGVGLLAQAVFLYFGAFLLGGAENSFGSIFTMAAWTRIPMAIAFLVQAVYVGLTQQILRYPGLSFLVATGDMLQDAQDPLFSLLSGIEFFWFWQLLLTIIGLTVVARLSWGKALLLTLVYAVLALIPAVLPAFLFRQSMAGQ